MRVMNVSRPGIRPGLSRSASATASSGVAVGPSLTPIGLRHPEKNSTCAPSSSRVRSPIQSMCAEQSYGSPGQRVRARERLLVLEQQPLVARPDVDLVQACARVEVDPDRLHEPQRALDLAGERLVALARRRARRRTRGSRCARCVEVREAALRERAQQVQRRRGLVVALDEPLGIGDARLGRRLVRVDDVPAEGRELDAVDDLGRAGARLRELPGDAPDLDHRERRAVGQHRRHLQQHLQLLADRRSRDVAERLDAVARLEEERAALADLAERREQRPRLSREDERRQRAQAIPDAASAAASGHSGCCPAGKPPPRRGRPRAGTRGGRSRRLRGRVRRLLAQRPRPSQRSAAHGG